MTANIKISSSPIFIVGAPRSGTTLLQYMLRSHPNISLPTGESHFFIPLLRNAESFGNLNEPKNIRKVLEAMYKQSADFLDTDIHGIKFDIEQLTTKFKQEGRNTITSIISGLFEKNALGEGKSRWGDKTPYYVLHMKTILEMYPDAQFIHLIRDGRDCALSMFARKHDFGVYNTFFAAKYWEIYVELGRQMGSELGSKIYHEIRYEDLLDTPQKTMQGVCEFLNEPYSDNLINFKKSGEAGKTPLLQKSLQKTNQEKWRTKMTGKQIALFEGAVGDTLQKCGYPLTTSAKPISLPIKAWWRVHNYIYYKYHYNFTKREKNE
ncbi:MAG: sulfotransferase [Methyloprofundus sp.]|nr:sulfotransferase [Methyloprofundus sp.]